jgi:SAM-dependent methyltransferase
MTFDAQSISAYFDQYGTREWERLVATPVDEISLYIHTQVMREHIPAGSRVLEIGAGAGRFTQVLAQIGARVVVADISAGQVALNQQFAAQLSFKGAVEDWHVVDICDLSRFPDGSFDRVVAYGGPFSYVLDRRDQAFSECLRVLRPGGRLLASVMCLWGSAHRMLAGTLDLPPEINQAVTSTGDLTPSTIPARKCNFMHMFRSKELCEWLTARGLRVLALSASGVLATGYGSELDPIRQNPGKWAELLRMELEASAEPGCLDLGTHLIFVVERE